MTQWCQLAEPQAHRLGLPESLVAPTAAEAGLGPLMALPGDARISGPLPSWEGWPW